MLGIAAALTSCNDYDYDSQLARTDITSTFYVTNADGTVYNASVDGNKITIKVNPFVDATEALANCYPTFFLPMGATCTPSPYLAQDFSKEVTYTVTSGDGSNTTVYTVNWGPSDQLPYGDGYTQSRVLCEKFYVELGYPGEWKLCDNYDGGANYGDLLLSIGFCGPDHLVGYSKVYGWGKDDVQPNMSLALKVWDAATLRESAKQLNLGQVDLSKVLNVTSDAKGHLVAAVGGLNNAPTDIYYWTSIDAAPVHLGTLPVPVYHNIHAFDANQAIDIAGDITGNAAISYMADRSVNGDHHVVYVRGGAIDQTKLITTGYPSNDGAYFQMISLFSADENSPYVVGDTEGARDTNGTVWGYYQSAAGLTLSTMGAFRSGTFMSDGIQYWSGTGVYTHRGGARRPFMMAMNLNGKYYTLALTGYHWENITQMMSGDMTQYIPDALSYDSRTYLNALFGSSGLWTHQSYGSCGTWYWDDETKSGKVAIWMGRETLSTFELQCYE